ncbi:MAG: YqeB family protein, partial [Pseudonocardiaceae bacterium]
MTKIVVDEPKWLRVGSWIGCPVLGAVAARLLQGIADWVASQPWFPFQGPFELVASLPEPQASIGSVVIGLIAGLVFAVLWARDRLVVTVSPSEVTLKRFDTVRSVDGVEA